MDYCYDLLNETFDLPALALEIAQRIKQQASCGIYDCVVSKAVRNGYVVEIEFKTPDNEYITVKFDLMKEFGAREYYEMMGAMGVQSFESLAGNGIRYTVCKTRDGMIKVIGVVKCC